MLTVVNRFGTDKCCRLAEGDLNGRLTLPCVTVDKFCVLLFDLEDSAGFVNCRFSIRCGDFFFTIAPWS